MARDKITEYSSTASENTVVGDVNIAENSALPSDMNNAVREVLSHQKEAFGAGTPLYVDQTNNRVGVNKTPTVALDVSGALSVSGAFTSQGIDDNADATAITIDSSENVSLSGGLSMTSDDPTITMTDSSGTNDIATIQSTSGALIFTARDGSADGEIIFKRFDGTTTDESMRIKNYGSVLFGTTNASPAEGTTAGTRIGGTGATHISVSGQTSMLVNRVQDGTIVDFRSAGTQEGTISISGTTTSYNGGHLSRWSRLLDNSKDTSIVKGTVMTNLNEMVEWKHEKKLWTKDDELPDEVSVGDVKKDAYTEDNEQLNKMAVSSVEGDANVAGVFVNWDNDDDFNDMNIAMTGDMVIRIAKGTTVARGDLLMSAGDGTAKPQDDDIVRSKTIAKVTSTNVSHTYDDGTYLVPCVLMAC